MIQLLRMRKAKKLQALELASGGIEGGKGRGTMGTEVTSRREAIHPKALMGPAVLVRKTNFLFEL